MIRQSNNIKILVNWKKVGRYGYEIKRFENYFVKFLDEIPGTDVLTYL